ncbi:hypothetical protein [Streptomyces sp. WAC 06783]|nr:hypothetical protein [Streptomyces sp. WAC 06783]
MRSKGVAGGVDVPEPLLAGLYAGRDEERAGGEGGHRDGDHQQG